jgi:hypothetical protein
MAVITWIEIFLRNIPTFGLFFHKWKYFLSQDFLASARGGACTKSFIMASKESTSLVQRCSDFVSEHKKAVIIGTAAVAIVAGGAAYYASTSRTSGGDSNSERKSRDKKKSGKSSKKRKTVNDKDGPILEERSPKIVDETGER